MTSNTDRLWVLIDASGLENGRADIQEAAFGELACLFTGDLEAELADYAPYLALVDPAAEGFEDALKFLAGKDCAVILVDNTDGLTFSQAHRHFRKFNVVYSPEGNPLFFRYYDGRVLPTVLDVLAADQLKAFFGPFSSILVAGEGGRTVKLFLINGELNRSEIDAPLHLASRALA